MLKAIAAGCLIYIAIGLMKAKEDLAEHTRPPYPPPPGHIWGRLAQLLLIETIVVAGLSCVAYGLFRLIP